MTQTLTTHRLSNEEIQILIDRQLRGDRDIDLKLNAALRELLANREAQPVGFYTTVSGRGGVVWHDGAPADDTAIYTAPPAPAVPPVNCTFCGKRQPTPVVNPALTRAPVVPDERAAFNAWNNEDNLPIAGIPAKNAAWLAWQARAMLAAVPEGGNEK